MNLPRGSADALSAALWYRWPWRSAPANASQRGSPRPLAVWPKQAIDRPTILDRVATFLMTPAPHNPNPRRSPALLPSCPRARIPAAVAALASFTVVKRRKLLLGLPLAFSGRLEAAFRPFTATFLRLDSLLLRLDFLFGRATILFRRLGLLLQSQNTTIGASKSRVPAAISRVPAAISCIPASTFHVPAAISHASAVSSRIAAATFHFIPPA